MSELIWKPNTTVAAVIEHAGRFLLVEEITESGLQLNQPAGHLDHGESLAAAVAREVAEESAYRFIPEYLVGIYQWSPPNRGDLTYLRFAFGGSLAAGGPQPGQEVVRLGAPGAQAWPLDDGIERAVWWRYEEVVASQARHRSPLLLQCVDDYRAGRRYPLELIRHYG